MAQEMAIAKTEKEVQKQIVVAENHLHNVKEEIKKLEAAKDAVQAEIDKKSSDYQIHFTQRDLESRKLMMDARTAAEKLDKDKTEFQAILTDFQKQKVESLSKVNEASVDREKAKAQLENIKQFIFAVQRAITLLGL